jgi:Uma2 family endonuclease
VSLARRNAKRHDPTYYPVDDEMGEGLLHLLIRELLRPLLARFLAEQGAVCLVGSNQFIYWEQYAPTKSVAPDLYVLPGVPPNKSVKSWKVWEEGVVPSFALEVVSDDPRKDYRVAPARYEELGVTELVIFDPEGEGRDDGARWQVFRRLKRRGFVRVESTNADRISSRVLGCWLRAVGSGEDLRVRVATGAHGEELFPLPEEEEREKAERELRKLRAEIARLRKR